MPTVQVTLLTGGLAGYWAYGSAVNPFLLFASSHPVGLVVSAEIAAAMQLQVLGQVGTHITDWSLLYYRSVVSWLLTGLIITDMSYLHMTRHT